MRDPFPAAPVLHLSAPRSATSPRANSERQHLARREQAGLRMQFTISQPVELPASHAAADQWTARHTVGAAIVRLNTLGRADGILAQRIDQL